MIKFYKLCLMGVLSMMVYAPANAQIGKPVSLGKSEDLLRQLDHSGQRGSGAQVSLRVSSSRSLNGKVNFKKSDASGEYMAGEIENVAGSSFFINIADGNVDGNIILKDARKAYKYYSDNSGNAFIEETDINKVICIDYEHKAEKQVSGQRTASTSALTTLESYPGARGCVLLDFDGQYVSGTPWNSGNPINAAPSGMSDAAVQEAWELVSEDFRPFHVNITTNEAVFNTYPKNMRMRCIITPTNTAAPGAGGVAYLNSFRWNDDTPCWVFITSGKSGGEAASHEIGHTFGLAHDGRTSPSEGYFAGHGVWAPIMGVGYYRNVTQWSKGEYANSNNKQDDLAIISNTTNNVGYRTDDHGNTTATATVLGVDGSGNVSAKGIIERTTDIDMFRFTTSGGAVSFTLNPVARHADLNILATLYNQAGTVISTYNPTGLPATISTTLSAGTYYISIDGTSEGDPATTGYSDYASLGNFTIGGKIPVSSTNQAPQVAITSPASGTVYTIPANIIITASASDADGTISKVEFYNGNTKLGEDASSPYTYTWSNVPAGSYTITARATDNGGLMTTSAPVNVTLGTVQNNPPVVSITSPANGAAYTSPATISINASATDADGSVSKVEFFNGTVKLGEDVTSPYSYSWSNVGSGTYTITARATDNAGAVTTSAAISINVTQGVVQAPYDQVPAAIPGRIEAEKYDLGGQGIAYNDLTSGNSGNAFRTDQVDVETCSEGGYNVGYIDAGEWLEYTVNVTATGTYTFETRVASTSTGGAFHIEMDGMNISGVVAVPNTGGWQNWQTVTVNNIALTAGTRVMRIYMDNSLFNINYVNTSAVSPAYCASRGTNSTSYGYINTVTLGSISNTSGNNSGYGNYTQFSAQVNTGATYRLYISPGFAGTAYTENWSIWIDYNRNGSFNDSGERIVYGTTPGAGSFYADFTVPATAVKGTTRMRVSMKYSGYAASCETFTYGEVEDYTVNIGSASAAWAEEEEGLEGEPLMVASANEIVVAPNPAENVLSISHEALTMGTLAIIKNVNGLEVKRSLLDGSHSLMDISDLPGGVYFVEFNLEGTIQGKRFIKL